MIKQSEIFLQGEAREWFSRNQSKLPVENDPIISAVEEARIIPGIVLEIGCSNGWRVKTMQDKWKCKAFGIDPFFNTALWNCRKGTADDLSQFCNEEFDMVIYGWCLYLVDREDLFKVVCEGDRVLKDGGYLIVYDFHTPKPHKRKYKHKEGLFSYKMDHAALWLANPSYQMHTRYMYNGGDDQTSVTVLRKHMDKGWPLHG